jgi:site-specific recombinase XerD
MTSRQPVAFPSALPGYTSREEGQSTRYPGQTKLTYYYYHPITRKQVFRRFLRPAAEVRDPRLRPGCAAGDAWIDVEFRRLAEEMQVAAAPTSRSDLRYWAEAYLRRHREEQGLKEDSQYCSDVRQYVERVGREAQIADLADPTIGDRLRTYLSGMKRLRAGKQPKQRTDSKHEITKRAVSTGTKNHYLRSLQSVSKFAYQSGAIQRDPLAILKSFRGDVPATNIYAVADLRRMLSDEMFTLTECAGNKALYGTFYFTAIAAYTGMRAETVINLTIEHIRSDQFGRITISVPASLMKARIGLTVAAQPELAAIITHRMSELSAKSKVPLVGERIREAHANHKLTELIGAYAKTAGVSIAGRAVHSLRNTFTSLRTAQNCQVFRVMQEVGHHAINSTRGYAIHQQRLAEEIAHERWPEADAAAIAAGTAINANAGPDKQQPLPPREQLYLRRSMPHCTVQVTVAPFAPRALPISITPPTALRSTPAICPGGVSIGQPPQSTPATQ